MKLRIVHALSIGLLVCSAAQSVSREDSVNFVSGAAASVVEEWATNNSEHARNLIGKIPDYSSKVKDSEQLKLEQYKLKSYLLDKDTGTPFLNFFATRPAMAEANLAIMDRLEVQKKMGINLESRAAKLGNGVTSAARALYLDYSTKTLDLVGTPLKMVLSTNLMLYAYQYLYKKCTSSTKSAQLIIERKA